MHGDVVGAVALDLVLRVIFAGMAWMSLVLCIASVGLDNPAAHVSGFGIPANVIADSKLSAHRVSGDSQAEVIWSSGRPDASSQFRPLVEAAIEKPRTCFDCLSKNKLSGRLIRLAYIDLETIAVLGAYSFSVALGRIRAGATFGATLAPQYEVHAIYQRVRLQVVGTPFPDAPKFAQCRWRALNCVGICKFKLLLVTGGEMGTKILESPIQRIPTEILRIVRRETPAHARTPTDLTDERHTGRQPPEQLPLPVVFE